jgi:hypothetical protein
VVAEYSKFRQHGPAGLAFLAGAASQRCSRNH